MSVIPAHHFTQEQLIRIEAEQDQERRYLLQIIFAGRTEELRNFLDTILFQPSKKRYELVGYVQEAFAHGVPIVSIDLLREWIEFEDEDIAFAFGQSAINNHIDATRHLLMSPSKKMRTDMIDILRECIELQAYQSADLILYSPYVKKSEFVRDFEEAIRTSNTERIRFFLIHDVHLCFIHGDDSFAMFKEHIDFIELKHARNPRLNSRACKEDEWVMRLFLRDTRLRAFCKTALYQSSGYLPPHCAMLLLNHTAFFSEIDNCYVMDNFISARNSATCDALCFDKRIYSTFSWYLTPFPKISMFRRRLLDVCIGLQSLRLSAWQTFRIIKWLIPHSVPRHIMWKFITAVKHFVPQKNN